MASIEVTIFQLVACIPANNHYQPIDPKVGDTAASDSEVVHIELRLHIAMEESLTRFVVAVQDTRQSAIVIIRLEVVVIVGTARVVVGPIVINSSIRVQFLFTENSRVALANSDTRYSVVSLIALRSRSRQFQNHFYRLFMLA